jgi:hypothetical protein
LSSGSTGKKKIARATKKKQKDSGIMEKKKKEKQGDNCFRNQGLSPGSTRTKKQHSVAREK